MKNFFFKILNQVKGLLIAENLNDNKELGLNEMLKESEMRYRRLFETAMDGILILDFKTGSIMDANPFILNIIGYSLEETIGKKLWEIGLFSNKDESEQAFIELKANGYIRFEDMPIQRRNGKATEVEFISNVYLVNNTKVIQCNIRDIAERKQAECSLLKSEQSLKVQNAEMESLNAQYASLNEELIDSINRVQIVNEELIISKYKAEEADRLKSAFLANMSHEIRTPMNAIMGFSDFLLEENLSKDKLSDFVQIINSSSMQLMSVISDIIDISKIESGQISIASEMVNVNNLLSDLFVTYKKIVKQKNISLHCSFERPNDVIQIKSDGNRIKQVLCNLLNNAIKFTNEGNIEFGYQIKNSFIEFYVKDDGIGISRENHDLIFHRFRQIAVKTSHIYGGNGLGLSISKALVEKLGGKITVYSKLGFGSKFVFTIPFAIDNSVQAVAKPEMDKLDWDEKTILVVEDEANSRLYLEELLLVTKVKIRHAFDGIQALEQIKQHPDISLVLMDIKLPEMDGFEATRRIKQLRPELPIIAQTAYALGQDKQEAFDAGCDDYIAKPIHKEDLMDLLKIHLS